MIKILISQLIPNLSKRGINELGTIWKWIAGTPDHDDFIAVQTSSPLAVLRPYEFNGHIKLAQIDVFNMCLCLTEVDTSGSHRGTRG